MISRRYVPSFTSYVGTISFDSFEQDCRTLDHQKWCVRLEDNDFEIPQELRNYFTCSKWWGSVGLIYSTAMPRYIRIRGKKGDNKQRKSLKSDSTNLNSRDASPDAQLEEPIEVPECHGPSLDGMPTEILEGSTSKMLSKYWSDYPQMIFLESQNLNLPLVSRTTFVSLATPRMKQDIVTSAFAMINLTADAFDRKPNKSDKRTDLTMDLAASLLHDSITLGKFQSSVLRQPWMTYDFLEKCQLHWLRKETKFAVDHFRAKHSAVNCGRVLRNWQESMHSSFVISRARLTTDQCDINSVNTEAAQITDPESARRLRACSNYVVCHGSEDRGLLELQNEALPFHHELPTLNMSIRKQRVVMGPVILKTRMYLPYFSNGENADSPGLFRGTKIASTMPFISSHLRVPSSLLMRPNTADKCKLLRAIYSGYVSEEFRCQQCRYEDYLIGRSPISYDQVAASEALETAIREYCTPIIGMLAVPLDDRGMDTLYDTILDIKQLDVGRDLEGKFGGSFTRSVRDHEPVFSVRVTDRHLIAAAEAAVSHGDESLNVLAWLLPVFLVKKWFDQIPDGIDNNPPAEPSGLVQWAIHKKVQEKRSKIRNGYGAKTLELLDHEQHWLRSLWEQYVKHGAGLD